MEIISKPHDLFFKQIMGDSETARDFLVNYLPGELLAIIELNQLTVQKDSFIEKELQETFSDLLYKTKIKGRDTYIYFLFEHKSYPLKSTAFQLLKYLVKIWEKQLAKKKADSLTPIIPLVIYQGRSKWSAPANLLGLLADIDELPAEAIRYIPDFTYILYDFSVEGDTEVRGSVKLSLYLEIIKNAFNKDPLLFINTLIKAILLHDEEPADADKVGTDFLETLIRYVLNARQDLDLEDIKEKVSKIKPEGSELIMTIAEKLINEGMEKGLEQGLEKGTRQAKAETAIRQLSKKLGPLPEGTLDQLKSAEIQTLDLILDNIFDLNSQEDLNKILMH